MSNLLDKDDNNIDNEDRSAIDKKWNNTSIEEDPNVNAEGYITKDNEEIDLSSSKVDKEMVDKILGEINMSEEDLEQGVITIKQWITTQPYLPPSAQSENLLKAFIVACGSVEKAKETLVDYYECRAKYQEPFFKDRDPRGVKWKSCHKFVRLPGLSPKGYIVTFIQLPDKNEVKDFDVVENCRASFMNLDIIAHSPEMNAGLLLVCDCTNFSARLMFKMMFNIAGQSSQIIQKAYPLKIIGFVTFNAPTLTEFFFNTFLKPFLSEELRTKNFMHSADHRVVDRYIPLEMLPCDYEGGKSPSMDQLWSEMKERILNHRDLLINEASELINEDLRPKPNK